MEDDNWFLFNIYKVLLSDEYILPAYREILEHYEFNCPGEGCELEGCKRLKRLDSHYNSCTVEECSICVPVRLMIANSRLNKVMELINIVIRPEVGRIS